MTSKAALFALLAMWGVGSGCVPAFAEDTATEETAEATQGKPGFTDRVWTKADADGLPGVMRIFLSDGTLVQDSCWETHRLSRWEFTSDTALKWNEDGMDVTAAILSLADDELVLSVNNRDAETFVSATVPYLCPDIPKS